MWISKKKHQAELEEAEMKEWESARKWRQEDHQNERIKLLEKQVKKLEKKLNKFIKEGW